jgi:hypothetical protein
MIKGKGKSKGRRNGIHIKTGRRVAGGGWISSPQKKIRIKLIISACY